MLAAPEAEAVAIYRYVLEAQRLHSQRARPASRLDALQHTVTYDTISHACCYDARSPPPAIATRRFAAVAKNLGHLLLPTSLATYTIYNLQ